MYSGKSGCIRAKIGARWLYSGIVVVCGQKVVVFGNSGCIRGQKWLYSDKVVVFGQKWLYSVKCIRAKVVVFGDSGCIWIK